MKAGKAGTLRRRTERTNGTAAFLWGGAPLRKSLPTRPLSAGLAHACRLTRLETPRYPDPENRSSDIIWPPPFSTIRQSSWRKIDAQKKNNALFSIKHFDEILLRTFLSLQWFKSLDSRQENERASFSKRRKPGHKHCASKKRVTRDQKVYKYCRSRKF